ncbi:hypothetical protein MSG28_015218 [Choristoneura fumiferana]|uniref:Uncharacterized protein n=1 Tax=Choristoneura fumiferana TaxID=7141 RepID=A0ACC0KYN5_CHOFU|nr:hypothetical protein MSG28_015218 [Choristoneura fumiferana]
MVDKYETVKLCYTIHKYSSYSANYIPENIMVNNPSDQLSRWFTDSNTPSQFIMLKIKAPAIVETIKFGKYIKAHAQTPNNGRFIFACTILEDSSFAVLGPAYNYTMWYVELQGKTHEDLMASVLDTINLRKEEEAVRMLLKHLRRRRYKDAFEALSRESGVKLEGDLQARLWHALVENGDYKLSEDILDEAVAAYQFYRTNDNLKA